MSCESLLSFLELRDVFAEGKIETPYLTVCERPHGAGVQSRGVFHSLRLSRQRQPLTRSQQSPVIRCMRTADKERNRFSTV